mgnify:CR=1 FL=1
MTGRRDLTGTVDLDRLLRLARDTSRGARSSLVAALGDLFAERERVLTERERALMTEILQKLVREVEGTVREQLARHLADSTAAPPDLVRDLANDGADVAAPILMRSPLLEDDDLIAVVRHRTQQHKLAVAQRADVSEPVSDALVSTDDDDVIVTLLQNTNARISSATAAYLTEQAKTLDRLQEPLVAREDLSPELARRLYWYVSAALRRQILNNHAIPESDLDDALERAVEDIADSGRAGGRPLAQRNRMAWELAARVDSVRGIDMAIILKALRTGEMPLFEALFGRFTGLRPPRLQYVIYEDDGRMLAVVARALDVRRDDFMPLYLLTRRDSPTDEAGTNLWRVLRLFDTVPHGSARTLLARWCRDPDYVDAIEDIEEHEGAPAQHPSTG